MHGVPIEAATLPDGWPARAYRLQNANTHDFIGWCVEAHDLAASKLAAFRDRDRDYVRVLLVERLIEPDTLAMRVGQMDIPPGVRETVRSWIRALVAEL